MSQTIIVTGASGFFGQFLVEYLLKNELTVIPVSRQIIKGMVQVQDYRQSPEGDVLIHLAEESDRAKADRQGEKYLLAMTDLVKTFASRSYKKIIYASSGAVYGDAHEGLCRVGMPVIANDTYNACKLINEQTVLDTGGCVARFSNLYGSGMSSNRVMSHILDQIPSNGPVYVRDDKPICDFLHLSDASSALEHLLKSDYSGIINVGSGIGTSVRVLARTLLTLSGQEDREVVSTAPASRLSKNVLDISETTKILGWAPQASLIDHLSALIKNHNETKP